MTIAVITQAVADLVPPVDKSQELYALYKSQVNSSGTAQKIFAQLERSQLNIGVLFVEDTVDSMYIPPFQFNGGGTYTGGVAITNVKNPLQIGDVELPLGISLIHELGHAVQYLNDTAGFEQKFKTIQSGVSTTTKFNITNAEGKALTKYLKNTLVAQLSIENDNVARHEAPVCDDLGFPFRKKYS
jgi:hypothetical protein